MGVGRDPNHSRAACRCLGPTPLPFGHPDFVGDGLRPEAPAGVGPIPAASGMPPTEGLRPSPTRTRATGNLVVVDRKG